jgi:hypothetical protein
MSTVTVAATVELGNVPPRVRLDVTDTGTPNLFAATVLRADPDGVARPVRTNDGAPLQLATAGANRTGLVYDYEVPYGVAVSYSTVETPGTVSAPVTVDDGIARLIHPGVPSLSAAFTIADLSERKTAAQRGVFYPMGRRAPVVQTDGQRKAAEWTLSIYTATAPAGQAVGELLDDASVLLVNIPAGRGYGIGAEYVSVGDVTERRVGRYPGEPARFWDLPLTVVDRPAGGTQAQRTLDDLLSYATVTALSSAYPTLNALLAGP